jgi:dTDP-4-amino-4,6-dideoxygalactose transaminase
MPDMGAIAAVTDAHGLALIEDAAQAQGSMWRGARAGSFGVASSFSFYPGKNLGAFGDAGAIVTDDAALADRIRQLANHGRTPEDGNAHVVVARNSRLDGLQAGVLSAKLTMLDDWNRARGTAAGMYSALLDPGLVEVLQIRPEADSVHHQFVVQVDGRDVVRAELSRHGVDSAVHYPVPCHRQPAYAAFAPSPLPVAERAAGRIMSLPLFPHITERQVEHVATSLNAAVRSAR